MTDEAATKAIEIIWASCLRRGMSREDADQVILICVGEYCEGDTRLLEFLLEKALH